MTLSPEKKHYSKSIPILVIGGGISGLVFSILLRRIGKKVVVVERHSNAIRKVCGEYLCPAGVKLLKELNLFDELNLNQYPKIKGMHVTTFFGATLVGDFGFKEKGPIFGLALNRQTFESDLRKLAISSGVEFYAGHLIHQVVAIEDKSGYILNIDGEKYWHTDFLVGADGRNSIVAKSLDLVLPLTEKRIALHTYLENKKQICDYGKMHICEDGSYIGIDPTDESKDNITLVCDSKALREFKGTETILKNYINNSINLKEDYAEALTHLKTIESAAPLRNVLKNTKPGHLALIGDAQSFIDPLTGEGMYNAIWMAATLAKELGPWGDGKVTLQECINRYNHLQEKNFKIKTFINLFFQKLIRNHRLMKVAYWFLKKGHRSHRFIQLIGNVRSPVNCLVKLVLGI